jgi:hypothetical protein
MLKTWRAVITWAVLKVRLQKFSLDSLLWYISYLHIFLPLFTYQTSLSFHHTYLQTNTDLCLIFYCLLIKSIKSQ